MKSAKMEIRSFGGSDSNGFYFQCADSIPSGKRMQLFVQPKGISDEKMSAAAVD